MSDDDRRLRERVAAVLDLTVEELHDPTAAPLPPFEPFSSRTALAIATRRVAYGANRRPPWDPTPWPELDHRVELMDRDEQEHWSRHPHVQARRTVAASPALDPSLLDVMADDHIREVRAAVLMNPATLESTVERRVGAETADPLRDAAVRRTGGDLQAVGCVECGKAIRNSDFTTCSITCGVRQTHRRLDEGVWAGWGQADRADRLGFRRHWPDIYRWSVAAGPASGGVPGTGPRKRDVLIPFLFGVTAVENVAAARALCLAGMPGEGTVRILERLAPEISSSADLDTVVREICSQDLTPEPFLA